MPIPFSAFGLCATMVLSLIRAPFFTLGATGAVTLAVTGDEARFGMTPVAVQGSPLFVISLGATRAAGSLTLSMPGGRMPAVGRYAIGPWETASGDGAQFEALFVAGSPEQPIGAFRAESGWVTITRSEDGRIAGEFELHARGFVAADLADEYRRVTVRGTFDAVGDGTIAAIRPVAGMLQ